MTSVPHGVGLLVLEEYLDELIAGDAPIDFVELVPENWITFGGRRRRSFDACHERWPCSPHSIALSIGGPDPLRGDLLDAIATYCARYRPAWWSDHLCYGTVQSGYLHALLPLPFSEEAVEHVVARVKHVARAVGTDIVLENIAWYAEMPGGQMDEATFINEVITRADCGLLLDVANVVVNSKNHGFDPVAFVDRLPIERVREIHVAGHRVVDGLTIDDHTGPVPAEVWALYRHVVARAGRMIPTLVEWETEIPPVADLLGQVVRARDEAVRALAPSVGGA